MDGQTDVGHINLIGGLVTRNPPRNVALALDKLSCCLEDVKRWLSTNKLKLNPDKSHKTEFIVFGSKLC